MKCSLCGEFPTLAMHISVWENKPLMGDVPDNSRLYFCLDHTIDELRLFSSVEITNLLISQNGLKLK